MPIDERDQKFLELVYGLLDEAEANQLRAEIARDPDAARRLERASASSRLFAEAAQLRLAPIRFVVPESPTIPASSPQSAPLGSTGSATNAGAKSRRRTYLTVLASIAAVWLVGAFLSLDARRRFTARLESIDGGTLSLQALAAGPLQPGVATEVLAWCRSLDHATQEADVQLALVDASGVRRSEATHKVRSKGSDPVRLNLPVPDSLPGAGNVTIEMVAKAGMAADKLLLPIALSTPAPAVLATTDRTAYAPGDTVHLRTLALDRLEAATRSEPLNLAIQGPGQQTAIAASAPRSGIQSGIWKIPMDAFAGKYSLLAEAAGNAAQGSKTGSSPVVGFDVERRTPTQLDVDIEYLRDSYSPGETVQAQVTVKNKEGVAVDASIDPLVLTASNEQRRAVVRAAGVGKFALAFALPKVRTLDEPLLVARVSAAGKVETASRPVPVSPAGPKIEFFPEGGGLVEGVANRVYFTATGPNQQGVQVTGQVFIGNQEVSTLASQRDGMGWFDVIGTKDQPIAVALNGDSSPADRIPLAVPMQELSIAARPGVVEPGKPIALEVLATSVDRDVLLTAAIGNVTIAQAFVRTTAKKTAATIDLPPNVAGVIRITAFSMDRGNAMTSLTPRAERLVFRRPARKLDVAMLDASDRYAPGDAVRLGFSVVDEQKRATPAQLGVAVVDESVSRPGDDRKPNPLTRYWLTSALQQPVKLDNANFYLDADPRSAIGLDLILGTQGFRRLTSVSASGKRPVGDRATEAVTLPSVADNRDRVTAAESLRRNEVAAHQVAQTKMLNQLGIATLIVCLAWIAVLNLRTTTPTHAGGPRKTRFSTRIAIGAASAVGIGAILIAIFAQVAKSIPKIESKTQMAGRALVKDTAKIPEAMDLGRQANVAVEPKPSATTAPPAVRGGGLGGRLGGGGGGTGGGLASTPAAIEPPANPKSEVSPKGPMPKSEPSDLPQQSLTLQTELPTAPASGLPPPANKSKRSHDVSKLDDRSAQLPYRSDVASAGSQAGGQRRLAALDQTGESSNRLEQVNPPSKEPVAEHFRFEPLPLNRRRTTDETDVEQNKANAEFGALQQKRPTEKAETRSPHAAIGQKKNTGNEMDRARDGRGEPALAPTPAPVVRGKEPPLRRLQRPQQPAGQMPAEGAAKTVPKLVGDPADDRKDLQRNRVAAVANAPPAGFVREFAFRESFVSGFRQVFPKTIYWNPLVETDADGLAQIQFQLPDTVTRYRVQTLAHAPGRLGLQTAFIDSAMPFSIEPIAPPLVRLGDRIDLPVRVHNRTNQPMSVRVVCRVEAPLRLSGASALQVAAPANGTAGVWFAIDVASAVGTGAIEVSASAGEFGDAVRKQIAVEPPGIEFERRLAGFVNRRLKLALPASRSAGTVRALVYPSIVAELKAAIAALESEPGNVVDRKRFAAELASAAYDHLLRLNAVDPATVRLAKRKAEAAPTMQYAQQNRAGYKQSQNDLVLKADQALSGPPARLLAKDALRLADLGKAADAQPTVEQLVKLQLADGSVIATSNQRADADDANRATRIETTALAVLAWLKVGGKKDVANRSADWLETQRLPTGGFGMARTTFLAALALSEREYIAPRNVAGGALRLVAGGSQTESSWSGTDIDVVPLSLTLPAETRTATDITWQSTGNSTAPMTVIANWRSDPQAADDPGLTITVDWPNAVWRAGNVKIVELRMVNVGRHALENLHVHVPVPASLTPQISDPQSFEKIHHLTRLELRQSTLDLIWPSLNPGEARSVAIPMRAEVPGRYHAGSPTIVIGDGANAQSIGAAAIVEVAH